MIPKRLRDRLDLRPGTALHVSEEEGRLVLSTARPAAQSIERDGFLVLDIGTAQPDPEAVRDERLRGLGDYALKR